MRSRPTWGRASSENALALLASTLVGVLTGAVIGGPDRVCGTGLHVPTGLPGTLRLAVTSLDMSQARVRRSGATSSAPQNLYVLNAAQDAVVAGDQTPRPEDLHGPSSTRLTGPPKVGRPAGTSPPSRTIRLCRIRGARALRQLISQGSPSEPSIRHGPWSFPQIGPVVASERPRQAFNPGRS